MDKNQVTEAATWTRCIAATALLTMLSVLPAYAAERIATPAPAPSLTTAAPTPAATAPAPAAQSAPAAEDEEEKMITTTETVATPSAVPATETIAADATTNATPETVTQTETPVAPDAATTKSPAVATTETTTATSTEATKTESAETNMAEASGSAASAAAANPNPINAAAVTTTPAEAPGMYHDRYEPLNRFFFGFNETLDRSVLKPFASIYERFMPKALYLGVHNFFNNIGELPTIANDILQLNFYQMANDTWRFGINTTIGIGGLFDVATYFGLKDYKNDFGLTLAAWGYENSDYLVLPFWGPSTIRDALPVDYFVFSIYPHVYPSSSRYTLYGVGVVDRRAQLLQYQDLLDAAAIDKYVFVRDAYLQQRNARIRQNQQLMTYDPVSTSTPAAKTPAGT